MNNKLKISFSILVFSFFAMPVFASQIYFGYNSQKFEVGEKFEIGVFIDTKEKFVNAIEGNINFESSALDFQGVVNGGSVINLWVSQPQIKEDGKVFFSGVTPGGYNSDKGYLFSLIFTAKKQGVANITTENEKIFINDGLGTKAEVEKAPIQLEIKEAVSNEEPNEPDFLPLYDNNPPEVFNIYLSKSDSLFSNKWFASFNSQDKESGVDRYEILEKPQTDSVFYFLSSLINGDNWKKSQSPYLLSDQSLQSVILVKAFDRQGNYAISALSATNKTAWYKNFWTLSKILGFIMILYIFYFVIKKVMKRRNLHNETN